MVILFAVEIKQFLRRGLKKESLLVLMTKMYVNFIPPVGHGSHIV